VELWVAWTILKPEVRGLNPVIFPIGLLCQKSKIKEKEAESGPKYASSFNK